MRKEIIQKHGEELDSLKSQFNILAREVKQYAGELKGKIKNQEIADLILGWRIMYSHLMYKPKVLFIGINPGGGQTGEHFDEEDMLEYNDDSINDYDLAKQTIEIFSKIGATDILRNQSVKSNYFFITTANQENIYRITNYLNDQYGKSDSDNFFSKASQWNSKMIEIIAPEIIICEGFEAYKNVTDAYYFQDTEWGDEESNETIKVCYNKTKNISFIGYKRMFSRIIDKEELSIRLKQLLK